MEIHPIANMLPELPQNELQTLADDIKRNGLHDPIVTWDGKILDGRNRFKACQMAGVDLLTEERTFVDQAAAARFVMSKNFYRRHMSPSQCATVAAEMAALIGVDSAVKETPGAKKRTTQQARAVIKNADPEIVKMVKRGEIQVNTAHTVSELPRDEQAKIVTGGADAVKSAAKDCRTRKKTAVDTLRKAEEKTGVKPAATVSTVSDNGKVAVERRVVRCEKCGEEVNPDQCVIADGRGYCSLACLIAHAVGNPQWSPVGVSVVNDAATLGGFFSALDIPYNRMPAVLGFLRGLK